MADYRKYYDSKYLATHEMPDGDTVVTIEDSKREVVGWGDMAEPKLCLKFAEFPKWHPIPKRDVAPKIAQLLGTKEVKEWHGRKIIIYVAKGKFGIADEAIRVKMKLPKQ